MKIFNTIPSLLLSLALATISLSGCSGKLNPGKITNGQSQNPTTGTGGDNGDSTNDGDDDGGGGTGGGGITVPPEVTMINLKGGETIAGGQTFKIYFSVKDESIGFNEVSVEYQHVGDTGWKMIADRVATLSDVETSVDWPVCPQVDDPRCVGQVDGGGFRLRITAKGKDNLSATAVSPGTFSIDSSPPSLTQTGLIVKPGTPKNGFVQFTLTGTSDSLSDVTDVCLKSSDFSTPLNSDACWVSLEAYGVAKSPTPAPITITQYLGFFPGTYEFYLWVRDAAGNMTTMTMNDSSAVGVNKDAVSVAYSYGNSPMWKDAPGDFIFNTDTTSATGIVTYTGVPTDNATTMADPGSFVINSKGQLIVNDKDNGIYLVDLVERTRTRIVELGGSTSEGSTGPAGTARVKNPLHIAIDEDDWIWIQDESRIAYIDSTGALKIAVGGGSNTNDTVSDPLQVALNYHVNMKWYGTFAVLPNKQVVFNSEDPHAALNPTSGSRFRLRVYHGKDGGRVDSILFSGSISGTPVDDLFPYGGMAFTYDTTRKYIKDIVGRFCTEASGTCSSTSMLQFSSKGNSPVLLNPHSNWSNVTLRASLDTVYAFNSQRGLLSKLDMTNKTWSKVLGGTARSTSYCNDEISATSCNVRLTDVFITKQNRVFFMDHSRLRSVEFDGRVQTLYNPEFDIVNAESCSTLRAAGHISTGFYSLDPDGVGGANPFTAYCDMTTDGGGWMLVARSVSGGTGAFGWKTATGDVTNNSVPFSMGNVPDGFTDLLFGSASTGKSWGGFVYKWTNVPAGYLTTYGTTIFQHSAGGQPTAVVGGGTNFAMARHTGLTDNTLRYFFRDNNADGAYGLYPDGWKTTATTSINGSINGAQGMIFVR